MTFQKSDSNKEILLSGYPTCNISTRALTVAFYILVWDGPWASVSTAPSPNPKVWAPPQMMGVSHRGRDLFWVLFRRGSRTPNWVRGVSPQVDNLGERGRVTSYSQTNDYSFPHPKHLLVPIFSANCTSSRHPPSTFLIKTQWIKFRDPNMWSKCLCASQLSGNRFCCRGHTHVENLSITGQAMESADLVGTIWLDDYTKSKDNHSTILYSFYLYFYLYWT
jgi:hypothetical protein